MKRTGLLVAALCASAAAAALAEQSVTSVRDRYPLVSPDGTSLLFESDRSGKVGLYRLDLARNQVRALLLNDGEPRNGNWSPDGMRIVYHERVGQEFDIFVVNADGSGRRNLTNSPYEEAHAHWGPDGRIYFNSDRAAPDRSAPWASRNHNLFSMAADGSDIRQLTRCEAVCTNPNPSPDGLRIAFRMGTRTGGLSWSQTQSSMNSEIALLDLQTGRMLNLTNNPAYDTWPSWSPDGKWVVYSSNRDGVANVGQLFMTRVGGAETRRLTSGPASHGEPSFSPDGRTLYFSRSSPPSGSPSSFIASMRLPPE